MPGSIFIKAVTDLCQRKVAVLECTLASFASEHDGRHYVYSYTLWLGCLENFNQTLISPTGETKVLEKATVPAIVYLVDIQCW